MASACEWPFNLSMVCGCFLCDSFHKPLFDVQILSPWRNHGATLKHNDTIQPRGH